MSIRDHRIVTIDVQTRGVIGGFHKHDSYTGLFPSEEYAKVWLANHLKGVSYEIIAIRTIVPVACVIAHSW